MKKNQTNSPTSKTTGRPLFGGHADPGPKWAGECEKPPWAKNTYTDEFKTDAVRLYEDTTGASFSSIAVDLGISRATLKNWVYAARKARGVQPSRTAEDPTDELLRLRKEVQHLRSETQKLSTERDILLPRPRNISRERRPGRAASDSLMTTETSIRSSGCAKS